MDGNSRNGRNGAYTSLNRPTSHLEMDDADAESLLSHHRTGSQPHVKHYDRKDSWNQLVKTGTLKFFITLFFGGVLCICLKAWEGFRTPIALSDYNVRIFNALTIAISICLGLNLLASLKRYAVILRWSILTKSYVSMEVFDLILGIDELTNVAKLLALSVPGLRRQRWLMGGSHLEKKVKSGTNGWYPFVCCIWLLLNIGSQVLVASLSLFWPMEPYRCQLARYGDVAVADLTRWTNESTPENPYEAAWRYGMDAQSWEPHTASDPIEDLSTLPGTPVYRGDGDYRYHFFYRNPDHPFDDYALTNRSIHTRATCHQLQTDGKWLNADKSLMAATLNGQPLKVPIPAQGVEAISWIGHTDKRRDCGPRCAELTVMQLKDDKGHVNKTSLWYCKNEVLNVEQKPDDRMEGMNFDGTRVNGTDMFAKIAAGAISWTGFRMNKWNDTQWRLYPQGTLWSPEHDANTTEIEDIIMRHTIGAIAAFDDHGIRYNISINDRQCDRKSQRLNVGWRYVTVILGSIALIQLSALCYLLARANKTIIRDSSFFSTAALLKPVIDVLRGEEGVMSMSGHQIKNHDLLRNRRIRYSYKSGMPGTPKRITVSFEDEDKGTMKKRWPSGQYT